MGRHNGEMKGMSMWTSSQISIGVLLKLELMSIFSNVLEIYYFTENCGYKYLRLIQKR
jgi:hypothetical protein